MQLDKKTYLSINELRATGSNNNNNAEIQGVDRRRAIVGEKTDSLLLMRISSRLKDGELINGVYMACFA